MTINTFGRPVANTSTLKEGQSGAAARADHDHGDHSSGATMLPYKDTLTMSGTTATWTLTYTPVTSPTAHSLHVYAGSATLIEGTDYTVSGRVVSVLAGAGLVSGDALVARYFYTPGADVSSFTPSSISGLMLWYSAEYEATQYSDSASLTVLHDLSGNGHDATVDNTLGVTTVYHAGGPSSGPRMVCTQGWFPLANVMSGATSGEVMCTLKSSGSDCALWAFGADTGTGDESHYPYGGVVYEAFGLASGQRRSFSPSMSITSWRRYNVWSAASDWAAQLDETSQATYTGGTVTWTSNPRLFIGRKSSANDMRYNSGEMGGLALFNRKLTSTERADLAAFFTAHPSGGLP